MMKVLAGKVFARKVVARGKVIATRKVVSPNGKVVAKVIANRKVLA